MARYVTSDRVLGHLAQRFSASEENVATEALVWILRRSAAARRAVIGIGRLAGCSLPDDLSFVGQVGDAVTGRPDVVGFDDTHAERLLIEAKFAAALTDRQPREYLKRLSSPGGILLVVAPSARRASLWSELLSALPDGPDAPPSPTQEPISEVSHLSVGKEQYLALVSWRHLVGAVLDAIRADGDVRLAQDAEQLLALTEEMDAAAFVPVRPGDLDRRSGMQVHQLARLLDDVNVRIPSSAALDRYGRNPSHGRIFYGWYVTGAATGKRFWFGFLTRAWSRHGLSPLWIQVVTSKSWNRQRLMQALAPFDGPGGPGVVDEGESLLVPLRMPAHVSQQALVEELVVQLEAVATRLAAVAPDAPTTLDETFQEDEFGTDATPDEDVAAEPTGTP